MLGGYCGCASSPTRPLATHEFRTSRRGTSWRPYTRLNLGVVTIPFLGDYILHCLGPTIDAFFRVSILTSVRVWALVVAHLAQNYGFYTLLTELPSYMANVLHFNIRDNSFISALPYVCMFLVSNTCTRLADYLLAAGVDRTTVRKVGAVMSLVEY